MGLVASMTVLPPSASRAPDQLLRRPAEAGQHHDLAEDGGLFEGPRAAPAGSSRPSRPACRAPWTRSSRPHSRARATRSPASGPPARSRALHSLETLRLDMALSSAFRRPVLLAPRGRGASRGSNGALLAHLAGSPGLAAGPAGGSDSLERTMVATRRIRDRTAGVTGAGAWLALALALDGGPHARAEIPANAWLTWMSSREAGLVRDLPAPLLLGGARGRVTAGVGDGQAYTEPVSGVCRARPRRRSPLVAGCVFGQRGSPR